MVVSSKNLPVIAYEIPFFGNIVDGPMIYWHAEMNSTVVLEDSSRISRSQC